MRNLSCENEFYMQFHFHTNQSHFHKNGFALRLALKQRHKGTRKWPILVEFVWFKVSFYFKTLLTKCTRWFDLCSYGFVNMLLAMTERALSLE